jgi:hypothetical protein
LYIGTCRLCGILSAFNICLQIRIVARDIYEGDPKRSAAAGYRLAIAQVDLMRFACRMCCTAIDAG